VRSRNGNFSFLFSSLALITTLSTGADNHYYIGYRFTTKNSQAINETLSISKAMRSCTPFLNSENLILKRSLNEPLENLLKREQEAFVEFAAFNELRVKGNDTFSSNHSETLSSMILPTRCYAVEFNNESVTITSTK
jgi:hypothetical protein